MYYILFNPYSSNGKSVELVKKVEEIIRNDNNVSASLNLIEVSKNISSFIANLTEEDKVVLVGGDGTLHYFVNGIRDYQFSNEVLLYKGGTGNDFSRELKKQSLINITNYIRNLPTYSLNDEEETTEMINGCGFGFDGEVCAGVNELQGKKTGLAYVKTVFSIIKGFPRFNVDVTVDGVRHSYKKVWLATLLNGKFFGGGLKISPKSDRTDDILEVCVVHQMSLFQLLIALVFLFFGKHTLLKKWGVDMLSGRDFVFEAETPQVFQSDGEVTKGVKKFVAHIDKK